MTHARVILNLVQDLVIPDLPRPSKPIGEVGIGDPETTGFPLSLHLAQGKRGNDNQMLK